MTTMFLTMAKQIFSRSQKVLKVVKGERGKGVGR